MKNKQASGSGMFLIELMLGIMIFAVAAAICLKIFVTANQISDGSTELNRAVIAAQSTAECFKASGGDLSETAKLLGENFTSGETLTMHFDSYTVEITRVADQPGLIEGEVSVSGSSGNQIFSIPITVLEVAP